MNINEEIRARALELAMGRNRATTMVGGAPDIDDVLTTASRFAHFIQRGWTGPRATENAVGERLLTSGLATCGEISLAHRLDEAG